MIVKDSSSKLFSARASKRILSGNYLLCLYIILSITCFIYFWRDKKESTISTLPSKENFVPQDFEELYGTNSDSFVLEQLIPNTLTPTSTCRDRNYTPKVLHGNRYYSVLRPMEEKAMQKDEIFFLLNGQNTGMYISYNEVFECIGNAAYYAAKLLGADTDTLQNGIRLYSQNGFPIRNSDAFEKSGRIVHILLDFQLWIWPGIRTGYKYQLENGVVLSTMSLSPKILDVEYFFDSNDVAVLKKEGVSRLRRSQVGRGPTSGTSKVRTSQSAFLEADDFIFFMKRAARVARLPSVLNVESPQLVRYQTGELYRQHLDAFPTAPKPWNHLIFEDYVDWTFFASHKIKELGNAIPEQFRPGGRFFPTDANFQVELIKLFHDTANNVNLVRARHDEAVIGFIADRIAEKEVNVIQIVCTKWPHYLPNIIKSWEDALGVPELRYTFPKSKTQGYSIFFNWVRWLTHQIAAYGTQLPASVQLNGDLYPANTAVFLSLLVEFVLEDHDADFLSLIITRMWYDKITKQTNSHDVLYKLSEEYPAFVKLLIRSWEKRAQAPSLVYTIPSYLAPYVPNRFVTLFLYANEDVIKGGETVFPYSENRFSKEKIVRGDMKECSSGLAVPARPYHASLFYAQTPEGETDYLSLHGACPVESGIKWGSNLFMWDSNAHEDVI